MASIALIGPDGAGKTTVSRILAQSDLLPVKYLYMGVAVSSSNMALPTTRLMEWLKQRRMPALRNGMIPAVPSLDAPGELLFARKGELTVAELERQRQGFLRQGGRLPNFVRIDATQPLTTVHDEVLSHVRRLCLTHESRSHSGAA